jgi:hypothetical protein
MTKKVSIKTKQQSREAMQEAWVKERATALDTEPIKRLTIDVPASLHKRIKAQCATNGVIMAEEIRALLEEKFPVV